jgi:hypothetical protein
MAADDENHFEYALGFAAVRRWADLSRETQQLLFDEATAGDDSRRGALRPSSMRSILRLPIREVGPEYIRNKRIVAALSLSDAGNTMTAHPWPSTTIILIIELKYPRAPRVTS